MAGRHVAPGARAPAARALAVAFVATLAACRGPEEEPQGPPKSTPGATATSGATEEPAQRRRFQLSNGSRVGVPSPQEFDPAGGLMGPSAAPTEESSEGHWLLAPVPFLDPTIGAGLGLGAGYIVPLDEGSPPSTIGGGVMASDNGSYGGALGFKGYFDDDSVRVAAGVLGTRLEFDLASDAGEIPLRLNVLGFFGEVLWRVAEHTYLGPQLLATGIDTDVVRSTDVGVLPDDELDTFNLAIGGRLQRDTRDSSFYPRTGALFDGQLRWFPEALGNPFGYQAIPVSYERYHSLSAVDVLALRVSTRVALGDVPFYGQSYFGTGGDLRGYAVGEYQDDVLAAAQAEWRREVYGRLGAVVFGGIGRVAPEISDLDDAINLPSVGVGLRLTLETENHVNFRVDVAWGRDDPVVYIGVGEAF